MLGVLLASDRNFLLALAVVAILVAAFVAFYLLAAYRRAHLSARAEREPAPVPEREPAPRAPVFFKRYQPEDDSQG
jgi:hypothetical protein